MKPGSLLWLIALTITGLKVQAQQAPLRQVQTIPLPGVEKRIDHMAVDAAHQRLFVAALGNNTLEVVDLHGGKRVHSIAGLHEPQGIAYVPVSNRLFVANAQGGACMIFDANNYRAAETMTFEDDADNVYSDPICQDNFLPCLRWMPSRVEQAFQPA